jgi:very-short-patch-repair endonuclease
MASLDGERPAQRESRFDVKRSAAETQAFLEAARLQQLSNPTAAEARLWPHLEKLGFERQRPILTRAPWPKTQDRPFILDFFHPGWMLCVEVDGSAHRFRKHRDRKRDYRLKCLGIRTIRITNSDVLHRLEQTVEAIKAACDTSGSEQS